MTFQNFKDKGEILEEGGRVVEREREKKPAKEGEVISKRMKDPNAFRLLNSKSKCLKAVEQSL